MSRVILGYSGTMAWLFVGAYGSIRVVPISFYWILAYPASAYGMEA